MPWPCMVRWKSVRQDLNSRVKVNKFSSKRRNIIAGTSFWNVNRTRKHYRKAEQNKYISYSKCEYK